MKVLRYFQLSKGKIIIVFTTFLLINQIISMAHIESDIVAWWKFDSGKKGIAIDNISGEEDQLSGNYRIVKGISGKALKLDGYTSLIQRKADKAPQITDNFTIEAWIAMAAYPWNWCPVLSYHQDKKAGFSFEIGPLGELKLGIYAGGRWQECISKETIPWKKWTHIACTFKKSEGIKLFLNGKQISNLQFSGSLLKANKTELILGSLRSKQKPAFVHRQFGTLPGWYSLDAILDEVKLYNQTVDPEKIKQSCNVNQLSGKPELDDRILPSAPSDTGRFGAYYTKLNYYWEWDDLWRVGEHPDVVVQFDNSPVRVVFWRGTRYSPAWVTENNKWMADQSVEAWNDIEGCFEHMQDPHCKYSHVRIIENTPARVVVHWRYAPVSSRDNLWRIDEKTGWACWVDEYYYFFPDQTGIRKVMWQDGSLKQPRQFQESIPFTGPGQVQGDIIHEDYVTIANLRGDTQIFEYIKNPPKKTTKKIPPNPLIQRHNFKAQNKPFIIFESGSNMQYLKDMNIDSLSRPGSCSHWPVGQLPCDGRQSIVPDRASSFLGFPITYPILHEGENRRNWVNSLYGMGKATMEELVILARSWNNPPPLKIVSGNYSYDGYDQSQRTYFVSHKENQNLSELALKFQASKESPLSNICLVINNWGKSEIEMEMAGKKLRKGKDFKYGYRDHLKGSDIIIWIKISSTDPITIALFPVKTKL